VILEIKAICISLHFQLHKNVAAPIFQFYKKVS